MTPSCRRHCSYYSFNIILCFLLFVQIERALILLSSAQGYDSPHDLYQTHARSVLTQLKVRAMKSTE